MTVSLDTAKLYLRVDMDDDDDTVTRLIAAATGHLESIGVDCTTTPVPDAVEQAILMLVGHFYENREAVADAKSAAVALGVDRLTAPYREQSL